MISEIPIVLSRAAYFFRRGMVGSGCVAFQAFINCNERKDDQIVALAIQAHERGDFLRVADLLEYEIAPGYQSLSRGGS